MTTALTALAATCLALWLGLLCLPTSPWRLRPVAEDEPEPPAPARWPSVAILVPARNEAELLPRTLPALLGQDYAGDWRIVLVDDRSQDGTFERARAHAGRRLAVVRGEALPAGWVGKVWALEQARRSLREQPDYLLLTDADIRHAPSSLRRLVAEAEAHGLALTSRMARLRCQTPSERLLIPPFLLFFNLLYPMRLVNRRPSRLAAAAGGCALVRRDALERSGGFGAIRDRVIDDVSLARAIRRAGGPLRLALSRGAVESLRTHDLGGVWRMVGRTAFTQLRRSWLLLALTLVLMLALFACPLLLTAAGIGLVAGGRPALPLVLAGAAWATSAAVYLPTIRYFRLASAWASTLPLAGLLYGAMTLDSALATLRPGEREW